MRVSTLILIYLFLFALPSRSQSPDESWLKNYIKMLGPKRQLRGNILVEFEGNIVIEDSFGLANEEWAIPNGPDTEFEIASVTKQFTAAAILTLADRGKLSLSDPIRKFYPQAPSDWNGITIAELLTHTSGLPNNGLKDFTKSICVPYTPEELIETFRNRPLVSAPGTKWAYTNTEYYLLAYLIEKLTNQAYGSYLADRIFRPLGMIHTGFDETSAIIPKMAEGYTHDQGKLRKRDCFDRSVEIGAGGIHTTAGDLLLWNHALNAPGLLSRESLIAMFTVHPPGPYGYGWFIEDQPVRKIYHQGGDPGFAAFEARYPERRLVILVLSNEDDAPVREISDAIAQHFLQDARQR